MYKSLKTIINELKSSSRNQNYISVNTAAKKILTGIKEEKLQKSGRENLEKDQRDQVAAGTYKTQHFEMSPDAQKLYAQNLPKDVNVAVAEKSLIAHDKLFGIEKSVKAKERATAQDVKEAETLVTQIKQFAKDLKLEKEHSYIDVHLDEIRKHLEDVPRNEVPEDRFKMEKIKRFASKPYNRTAEPPDRDIDNDKFVLSRGLKMQRKIKIIDED